jgi:multidrug resistance efflux pump
LDEKRQSDALMAEIRAKIEAEKAEGIGPRLERYYERFRSGEITLEEYKAEVLEQQADTKEELRLTRACRSDAVRAGTLDEHEAEVEQLQEDLEECAWRLGGSRIKPTRRRSAATASGSAANGQVSSMSVQMA